MVTCPRSGDWLWMAYCSAAAHGADNSAWCCFKHSTIRPSPAFTPWQSFCASAWHARIASRTSPRCSIALAKNSLHSGDTWSWCARMHSWRSRPALAPGLLHVRLARLRLLAELGDVLLAGVGHLGLVGLEALRHAALAGLHSGAELLGVGDTGMRGLRQQQGKKQRHGSILARVRMLSVIDGSCGTDAISRLSARPMPGMKAPAKRRGGASSS